LDNIDLNDVKDALVFLKDGLHLIKEIRSTGKWKNVFRSLGFGKDKLHELADKIESSLIKFPEIEKAINFYIDTIPQVAIASSIADKIHEIVMPLKDMDDSTMRLLNIMTKNLESTKSKLLFLSISKLNLFPDESTVKVIQKYPEDIRGLLGSLNNSISNRNAPQTEVYSRELSTKFNDLNTYLTENAKQFANYFCVDMSTLTH
jgi:hypothetical protein